jgi:hypothetical protein
MSIHVRNLFGKCSRGLARQLPSSIPFNTSALVFFATTRLIKNVNVQSDSAREPCRDLLDYPRITVGIIERTVGPVARALRVAADEPRLRRKRRPVPHLTHVDAPADKFVMSSVDVGDD